MIEIILEAEVQASDDARTARVVVGEVVRFSGLSEGKTTRNGEASTRAPDRKHADLMRIAAHSALFRQTITADLFRRLSERGLLVASVDAGLLNFFPDERICFFYSYEDCDVLHRGRIGFTARGNFVGIREDAPEIFEYCVADAQFAHRW